MHISATLTGTLRDSLIKFLTRHRTTFTWSHSDMEGINPKVIAHHLNVLPDDKLLAADFIREVHYLDWLSNVVMVKKTNEKRRMCVDFKDLNRSCLNDSFPLPRIDLLVDSTAEHEMLSFLDAFSGYNQIKMDIPNQEKTAFVTDRGLYCYKVMHFRLKNAGATYQRLVNHMFKDQIGKNIEVYVDDMLVKSTQACNHLADLEETFNVLD